MNRALNRTVPRVWPKMKAAGELRLGCALALSAGIGDVSMAMLDRPRDFGVFASMVPPILAIAAVVVTVYALSWAVMARMMGRGRDTRGPAAALAAFLAGAFTLTMLLGLHTAPWSAHTAFRAAIVLVLSGFIGAGAYALHATVAGQPNLYRAFAAVVLAAPVVLFEFLTYQWLQVYTIDSIASGASVLASVALVAAAGATLALFVRLRHTPAPGRVLAGFAVLLVLIPILRGGAPGRSVTASAEGRSRTPARIVLISVDTLRADAVSAYGAGASRTPAIDRLASDSLVFENAISPSPWTLPSMTSILTGLSPSVHLATDVRARLSNTVTTLAERLSGAGYHTAALVHNDLLHPTKNLAQGFADYMALNDPSYGASAGALLLQRVLPSLFPSAPWPSTTDHTNLAIEWLEANREKDFFFWLHYRDPHAPFTPPREHLRGDPPPGMGFDFGGQEITMGGFVVPSADERRWIRALYDAEVEYVDAQIGRLLDTLKRMDLYDDALIILTSDHGEEFWEHGAHGHGHTMYAELLHVPLILKMPGSSRRERIATAVSTTSIAPTVLDVTGIGYNEADLSAGSVLRPAAPEGAGRPLVSTSQILYDRREAVVMGGFKYVTSRIDGTEQLFALDRDPGERHSIAASAPAALAAARAALTRHHDESVALRRRLGVERGEDRMDDDTLRRLRSLGYIR